VSVEVAVSSFSDQRSLRAALKDVDVLYHLAGAERKGLKADLNQVDVEGTATLMRACRDSSVKRVSVHRVTTALTEVPLSRF